MSAIELVVTDGIFAPRRRGRGRSTTTSGWSATTTRCWCRRRPRRRADRRRNQRPPGDGDRVAPTATTTTSTPRVAAARRRRRADPAARRRPMLWDVVSTRPAARRRRWPTARRSTSPAATSWACCTRRATRPGGCCFHDAGRRHRVQRRHAVLRRPGRHRPLLQRRADDPRARSATCCWPCPTTRSCTPATATRRRSAPSGRSTLRPVGQSGVESPSLRGSCARSRWRIAATFSARSSERLDGACREGEREVLALLLRARRPGPGLAGRAGRGSPGVLVGPAGRDAEQLAQHRSGRQRRTRSGLVGRWASVFSSPAVTSMLRGRRTMPGAMAPGCSTREADRAARPRRSRARCAGCRPSTSRPSVRCDSRGRPGRCRC